MPQILATLTEHPATLDELTARLADDYGLVVDTGTRAILSERLSELESIGLVWRA